MIQQKTKLNMATITDWLLLYTIWGNHNHIDREDISTKLGEVWKGVHAKNPNFYLVFTDFIDSHGKNHHNGFDNTLNRYINLGYLDCCYGKENKDDVLYCSLAPKGMKLLKEYKKRLEESLGCSMQISG